MHRISFWFGLGPVCGGLVLLVLSLGGSHASLRPARERAPGQPTPTAIPASEPLPPGVTVTTILSDTYGPIAMAFDPAGRLFYTDQNGRVRLVVNDTLQPTPVFTVDTDFPCDERGLLGLTLDPAFSQNHYVYLYTTAHLAASCGPTVNRVIRFQETNGLGHDPVVLFSSPQPQSRHNAGNLHFGPDGKLYISVGDGYVVDPQNVTLKNGKFHRINADGSIPADNPVFTETGAVPSLFARGLRNSFDFTFDPLSQALFASENGPSCDDELNRIVGGANYGWRAWYPCDDDNPDPTYNTIPPLWYVPNGQCCIAPTGVEVYSGARIPQWQNELFMCSYNHNTLHHIYLSADRQRVLGVAAVQGVGCTTDLATSPDGAFYYAQFTGSTIQLNRLVGSGPTSTPAPPPSPGPSSTPPPLPTPSATPPPTCDRTWQAVPSADPGAAENTLYGVAAVSANDVWAVGTTSGSDGQPKMLIEHWNGGQWQALGLLGPGSLRGVAVGDATNIWAVGNQAVQGRILHWDGTMWSTVPHPAVETLRGLAVRTPGDAWAVGDQSVLHWDGSQWSTVYSHGFYHFYAVAALAADNVWVVGDRLRDDPGLSSAVMLHWDGSSWVDTVQQQQPYGAHLYAIAANTPNDIWAAGNYQGNGFGSATLLEHWDGASWTVVPGPNPGAAINYLAGLAAVAPNDVWAVGASHDAAARTFIAHWDGSAWSQVPSPSVASDENALYGLVARDPDTIWAVGYHGAPLNTGISRTQSVRLVYPCGTPTATPTGTPPSATPTSTATRAATPAATARPATSTPPVVSTAPPSPTATPPSTACPIQFTDVPPGSTFYIFIHCLACRGIVGGYPCSGPGERCPGLYYRPGNNVTRGQVAKIVASAAGFSDPVPSTQQTFQDVPPGSTFALWVERLSSRAIIGGYPCGGVFEPCVAPTNRPYFRPNNNVTRGQLAKITSGTAGYSETPTAQTFADVPPGSTFYLSIERLASQGIIGGYPCGDPNEPCLPPDNRFYFRPNNPATRGQMSKIAAAAFFPNCATPARR